MVIETTETGVVVVRPCASAKEALVCWAVWAPAYGLALRAYERGERTFPVREVLTTGIGLCLQAGMHAPRPNGWSGPAATWYTLILESPAGDWGGRVEPSKLTTIRQRSDVPSVRTRGNSFSAGSGEPMPENPADTDRLWSIQGLLDSLPAGRRFPESGPPLKFHRDALQETRTTAPIGGSPVSDNLDRDAVDAKKAAKLRPESLSVFELAAKMRDCLDRIDLALTSASEVLQTIPE